MTQCNIAVNLILQVKSPLIFRIHYITVIISHEFKAFMLWWAYPMKWYPIFCKYILRCLVCIGVSCLVCIVVVVLCVLLSSYVSLLYYVCIAFFTLEVGLLARSQYSEGPATGHLDTSFLGFPVSISKSWDGSQDSKLPLHASHVALPT